MVIALTVFRLTNQSSLRPARDLLVKMIFRPDDLAGVMTLGIEDIKA